MPNEFPARRRVLLVEDDDALRSVLSHVLEQAGYEVQTACNGKEALGLYRACPADVVVSDVLMPERDGLELLLELQRAQPPARFIAISGGGLVQAKLCLRLAIELGAARVLRKPFQGSELVTAVQQVLGVV